MQLLPHRCCWTESGLHPRLNASACQRDRCVPETTLPPSQTSPTPPWKTCHCHCSCWCSTTGTRASAPPACGVRRRPIRESPRRRRANWTPPMGMGGGWARCRTHRTAHGPSTASDASCGAQTGGRAVRGDACCTHHLDWTRGDARSPPLAAPAARSQTPTIRPRSTRRSAPPVPPPGHWSNHLHPLFSPHDRRRAAQCCASPSLLTVLAGSGARP